MKKAPFGMINRVSQRSTKALWARQALPWTVQGPLRRLVSPDGHMAFPARPAVGCSCALEIREKKS